MEKKLQYTVRAEELPCTVGTLLRKGLGLTKHQIRSAKFRTGGICVNGISARVNTALKAGDILEVLLERASDCSGTIEATEEKLEILYEDEDLILINKKAGVAVHPGHGHYRDTVANYLLYYFGQKRENVTIRAVGRLDKDTSGIVVFAKNKVAASRLTGDNLKKEYVALIRGHLTKIEGCIELPIGKKKDALNQMEVSETGRFARTYYRVLEEYEGSSLVRLWLDTGRTHQIRVHMAAIGHPLLGDPIYGGDSQNTVLWRAALHCEQVEMKQPFTGEKIHCTAPLAEDMKWYIEQKRCGQRKDSVM